MKSSINRTIVNLVLALIVLGFLAWLFSDIVAYIILALVLSAVLRTPTNYISQLQVYGFRIPRIVATIVAFSLIIGLFSLFVYLFVPLVSTQVQVISSIDFEGISASVVGPMEELEDFLLTNGLMEGEEGFLLKSVRAPITDFIKNQLSTLFNSLLSITSTLLIGMMAVLFITFFMLYEKGLFRRYLISMIPNKYFEVTIAAFTKVERLLSNYLLGLLLQMISIFSVASFGLLIVGVEYAVTIAVFAAVANLIPFLGPILGASFGLIVGLSTNTGLAESQDYLILVAKIIGVFGVVQLTDNIFLQPIIFSRSVKAHPLEIFLIVFVGANLGGPVGMIAAIPSYTILKVTFTEFYRGYQQYQIFRN